MNNGTMLDIRVASDLHLFNPRNTAPEIVTNLRAAFPDTPQMSDCDMLVLAGDVFDRSVFMSNEYSHDVDMWIAYMLRLCKKHHIALRVLDGTKSHDWYQSQRFETLNEVMEIGCDVKYIRDLSIEYMPQFDINVLYVPDEWQPSTERTLKQVKDLLRAKGLEQVDYAMMHGQFEYQLPPHIEAQKHSSSEYLKLVRELIFIGHVHKHSRYDRIIAQGSFDRMSHAEEEAKGYVHAQIYPGGRHDITFVENKGAKTFKTVNCLGLTLEETFIKVEAEVKDLRDNSFVRVEVDSTNPIVSNMDSIVRMHPRFTWAKLVREEKKEEINQDEPDTGHVGTTLTRDNLGQLLMERLTAAGATSDMLHFADTVLTEVL